MRFMCVIVGYVMLGCSALAQTAGIPPLQQARGAESRSCCVVLATDMSGSMNTNDPLVRDPEGKLQAIRDDAQLTCLQLIRTLSTTHYIGVCKFSDTVAYGHPGGPASSVTPSESLQVSTEIDRDWEKLREELSTKKPVGSGGTQIDQAMAWARQRIELARQWRCPGAPGVLILLTDGDPQSAYEQVLRGGPVPGAADRLTSAGIRVYPIIINTASYRPGRVPARLSAADKAAEELMDQVARKTGGKAYRITADFGLLDIFLEILQASLGFDLPEHTNIDDSTGAFPVGRHHRSVIMIGPAVQTVRIDPFKGQDHTLSVSDGPDATTGIGRKVIPLARWDVTIFRRPDDLGQLDRFWSGNWRPVAANRQGAYDGRIYLVTDFLLDTQVTPRTPWVLEPIQIRSGLVKRPEELGEPKAGIPPLGGTELSLKYVLTNEDREQSTYVARWNAASQAYECDAFGLHKPGQYGLTCVCADHVNGAEIPLGRFSGSFVVAPCPVSLVLTDAQTGQSVKEIPHGRATTPSLKGGQTLRAQLEVVDKAVRLDQVEAHLELENATPGRLAFRRDSGGTLATQAFALPEMDTHLFGRARVTLRTSDGVRQIPLELDLPLGPAERRLEWQFSDSRTALWVGEYHQQSVLLSVLPIFDDKTRREVAASFPSELPAVTLKVIGGPGGQATALPVRCARMGSAQATGPDGRKVSARYVLESSAPIPSGTSIEIDLGPVVEGLSPEKKQYGLVDPIRDGLFSWCVFQNIGDSSVPGVVSEINATEPTWFTANWRADQRVSGVSFETLKAGALQQKPLLRVELPITEGQSAAQTRNAMAGLSLYENYDVTARVILRPPEAQGETQVRLHAGRFVVQELQPKLKQLAVGETSGADISCFALERKELPLCALFTNYRENSADHRRTIEDFKKSCRLVVVSEGGAEEDLSGALEWTKAEAITSGQGDRDSYRLEGQALWVPTRTGRSRVELTGQMLVRDKHGTIQSVQSAGAGLFVRKPRYRLVVSELLGDGEKTLYDSDRLTVGQEPQSPRTTAYSTRLHVLLELAPVVQIGPKTSQTVDVQILRQDGGQTLPERWFSRTGELTRDSRGLDLKPEALEDEGEYSLRVVGSSADPNAPTIDLTTPVLVRIGTVPPLEIIAPPAVWTMRMRQVPFQYETPVPVGQTCHQFQFQLPGMEDRWLDGIAFERGREGARVLVMRSPAFLDEMPGKTASGRIRFKIRWSNGGETTWRSGRSVQVVEPWLQGLHFLDHARNKTYVPRPSASITVKVPIHLRAERLSRPAPELEGWWVQKETRIYVMRRSEGDPTDGEMTARLFNEFAMHDPSQRSSDGLKAFVLEGKDSSIDVLEQARRRVPFWGWPRWRGRDPYIIVAAMTYESRPEAGDDVPVSREATDLTPHFVSEWSPLYSLDVITPVMIPYVWWLTLLPVICLAVWLLKLGVPSPETLRLHVQLERCEATVEPAADIPKVARICETSLSAELARNGVRPAQGAQRGAMRRGDLLTILRTCLRRLFVPRRRALIHIRPNSRPGLTNVHGNRLCIWTGVINRQGRITYDGSKDEPLPEAGKSKSIKVDMSVTINGATRPMPVPVTIRRIPEAAHGHGGTLKPLQKSRNEIPPM